MKSSTLMAIILVAQAVLIMGVFAAVSSIENSAGVGEKKVTMEEPKHTCCDKCESVSPPSGLFKCQDTGMGWSWCKMFNCSSCAHYGPKFQDKFICNDKFYGSRCCPKKN